jgi:N-methylhydantoinase B
VNRLTLEVIGASLLAIAEEMGSALIRSSYSTNIKERQDCSTAIFDAEGEVIAQAEHIPMHLGSLLGVVREILRRYPVSELADGDVFISNDPYTGGGTHLPDINLINPVFANGELFGFVANIAHHADRSSDSIQAIWDEGVRITPIRLVEAGEVRDDLMELLLANYALPRERLGDIRAQMAANRLGERRIHELIDRHGVDTIRAAYQASLAYGERKIRSAISELPDGVYAFRDAMDGDGVSSEPIPIAVEITKRGDELVLDFSGSGPQCAGDINVVFFALLATVYYALKAALDPSVPANSGFYRAIDVVAPEGTIVNAQAPAPVGWRTHTCQRIADVVLGALAQVVPERIPAAGNGANSALVFSGRHPDTGESYIYFETLAGGAGATASADGMDAVQVHVTNTSNLPVEALETEYPLLVSDYSLLTDSGGPGRHRGGMGLRRSIEILDHDARLLATTERALIAPWGLLGGEPGGRADVTVTGADGSSTVLPPKVWGYKLRPGDRVTIDTPGAGGYGPVAERPAELLRQDKRDGIVPERLEHEEVGDAT